MGDYQFMGIPLWLLGAGSCVAACVLCALLARHRRKRPLYRRKLPKIKYPEGFAESMRLAYGVTGDIRGMLRLLQSQWQGKTTRRIAAALDYLENSRYRDYETALYEYLADGSMEIQKELDAILEKEIRKLKGLPGGQ